MVLSWLSLPPVRYLQWCLRTRAKPLRARFAPSDRRNIRSHEHLIVIFAYPTPYLRLKSKSYPPSQNAYSTTSAAHHASYSSQKSDSHLQSIVQPEKLHSHFECTLGPIWMPLAWWCIDQDGRPDLKQPLSRCRSFIKDAIPSSLSSILLPLDAHRISCPSRRGPWSPADADSPWAEHPMVPTRSISLLTHQNPREGRIRNE